MTITPPDGWYVRTVDDDHQLWKIAGGRAIRPGVTAPGRGPGTYFEARPEETIWDAIRRETPWLNALVEPGPFTMVLCTLGQFFPRMARPIIGYGLDIAQLPNPEAEQRFLQGAQTQLEALVANLKAVCRVVEPSGATLDVHGHEIRNLLILAATEV